MTSSPSIREWVKWRWRQYGLVAACLALSAMLALSPSPYYLLLLLGLAGCTVILRWPCLGLVLLVPASLLVPLELPVGRFSTLNPAVGLMGLLVLLWMLAAAAGRERLILSRPVIAALLFAILVMLSLLVGQITWHPLGQRAPIRVQIAGAMIYLLSVGAFLLVGHQVRDLRWLRWLVWSFLGITSLRVFGQFIPGLRLQSQALYPSGAIGSLFWIWMEASALGQALFNSNLRPFWRWVLGALVVAAMYLGLGPMRGWTASWLPPLVALLVIFWLWRPRLTVGLLLLAGPLLLLNQDALLDSLVRIGGTYGNEWSVVTRIAAWGEILKLSTLSPLLGLGPANYFWYTPLYSIMGYHVNFIAHNQYLDIVAQMGWLGLAGFMWLVWEIARLGWQLRTEAPEGFEKAYVHGAIGGLVGTLTAGMLVDWFLPFAYNIGLAGFRASVFGWVFLGGLVAIRQKIVGCAGRGRHGP